ncbi:hypothetical protein CJD36_017485 [Flavipsychrobacter stenotrophus]|uniref:Thioredoxin-like fold domain-containing protein n=2 Tax=Flavipsychrobacter stenotrophus TaxID=2077091 RepID=A0A2S7SS28_9BACT|nr:hypothetical protein CJD36_017485 [Flavipsychrobacter stenotrophus]
MLCKPSMLGPLLSDLEHIPTYGDFFKKVEPMLIMPEYVSMKQNVFALAAVLDKDATAENWDKDTRPLLELGYTAEDLATAKEFMLNKHYEHPTYRSVFFEYTSVRKAIEEKLAQQKRDSVATALDAIKTTFAPYCDISQLKSTDYNTVAFTNYEAGMQCAKKMHRPVLIFFNAFNSVNSRKMVKAVLADAAVKSMLEQNYVLIDLLCDDREPLPKSKEHFSKALNMQIATIGLANAELELATYKSEYVPFFVVLNSVGKKVATIGYTNLPKEMMTVLMKGIGK